MTISEMFTQSAVLTALGMIIVFAFLTLMIVCVTWAGILIHALGLDKDVKQANENVNAGVTPQITAVITAAVAEHQKKADA
jgi:oxaloacetate decarboxylase gamma subunit